MGPAILLAAITIVALAAAYVWDLAADRCDEREVTR